jgi:putative nucleotidyltransferase with HDIG domain
MVASTANGHTMKRSRDKGQTEPFEDFQRDRSLPVEKLVDVRYLRPGVFVCRLDRPWVETRFRFQGLVLRSMDEVKELQRCCNYVYIDPTRGLDAPGTVDFNRREAKLEAGVAATAAAHPEVRPYETDAANELGTAIGVHGDSYVLIDNILEDARLGRSVDSMGAKQIVGEMAASIMRNPDALLFLTQLNDKDNYTTFHSIDVCILSLAFGRHLGLEENDLNVLGLGALLHDIGKMRIPPEVLNKAGRLSNSEFKLMKSHVEEGVKILRGTRGISQAAVEVVQNHHERFDGSGYLAGLRGKEIGLFGSIAGIADVYDAVTSDRVYHPAITPYEALKHLYQWRKNDFEEALVLQFIQCIGIYPVGSLVSLTTGDLAVVVAVHPDHRLRPTVKLVVDPQGQRYEKPVTVDLMQEDTDSTDARIDIRAVADPAKHGIRPAQYLDILGTAPTGIPGLESLASIAGSANADPPS